MGKISVNKTFTDKNLKPNIIEAEETEAVFESPEIVDLKDNDLPPGAPVKSPESRDKNAEQVWDRLIRGLIYTLAFVLPLAFTPWTLERLEFSKQMVLFILISAALTAWLLKILVTRTFRFVKTPLDLPILAYLAIYLLASIFSVDRVASFMGFYGSFHGNFFQLLFLTVFYYLIVNNFATTAELKKLVGIFILSTSLTLIFVFMQFFGWFVLPFDFSKFTNFNTVGGLLILAVFSCAMVILHLGFKENSWFSPFGGKLWRIIGIAAAFIVLLTVNFNYAWMGLIAGLFIYMVFQIGLSPNFSMKNIVAPLVLAILVIGFLVSTWVFRIAPFGNMLQFDLAPEVRLDYKTASPVLKGSVAEKPVLGSGPNTFLYAFSKHREESFNTSQFWNERFGRAPSEAAEYLVGTGILGLLAFEILSLVFMGYAIFFLLRRKDPESWNLALTLFSSFAALWILHWFFFFNTTLSFIFWLLIGSFVAVTRVAEGERVKITSFSFANSPRQTVSAVSIVSLSLVLVIVFLFFASAIYSADVYYNKGLKAVSKPETYDQAQSSFERAIQLNRFRPDYYLSYGEFLSIRINQELAKPNRDLALIENWLTSGINVARQAVELSPNNWTAWERLAGLYTFARPLVAGVDKFIIESLTKATEQNPNNPILFLELGQVYRLASRRLDATIVGKGADSDSDGLYDDREKELGSDPDDPDTNANGVLDGNEVLSGLNPAQTGALPDTFLSQYIKTDPENQLKAIEAFRKAIALKPDYAAAYVELAATLSLQHKYAEAALELEKVVQLTPQNIDSHLALGVAYYNAGRIDDAVTQFQLISRAVPNHANARFFLALSLERLGNLKNALAEYRKVLELNPDNELLKTKVADLERLIKAAEAPVK